jgi:hypothetical protein
LRKSLLILSRYNGSKIRKLEAQSNLIESSKNLFEKEVGEFKVIKKIAFMPEDPTTAQIEK